MSAVPTAPASSPAAGRHAGPDRSVLTRLRETTAAAHLRDESRLFPLLTSAAWAKDRRQVRAASG